MTDRQQPLARGESAVVHREVGMRVKRMVSAGLVALALVGGLVGCGGDDDEEGLDSPRPAARRPAPVERNVIRDPEHTRALQRHFERNGKAVQKHIKSIEVNGGVATIVTRLEMRYDDRRPARRICQLAVAAPEVDSARVVGTQNRTLFDC